MRKYRHLKFGLWLVVILLACIFMGIGITILFPYTQKNETSKNETDKKNSFDKYEGNYNHVLDTVYIGDPYVSGILFDYPFGKTESYMKNKDFIKNYGEEEAQKLVDMATHFMMNFFDMTYRNIHEESVAYVDSKLDDGFLVIYNDGTIRDGKKEFLENWYQWCVENKLSMKAEFTTDKSLIFYDDGKETARGLLLLTFLECDDKNRVELELGLPKNSLKIAKEIALIVDIDFATASMTGDRDLSYISGMSIVDVIYQN